jgi:hypothetical protein
MKLHSGGACVALERYSRLQNGSRVSWSTFPYG